MKDRRGAETRGKPWDGQRQKSRAHAEEDAGEAEHRTFSLRVLVQICYQRDGGCAECAYAKPEHHESKDRHSPRKVFRNLDLKTTLRRNLKNYDKDSGKLFVDRVYFYAAERKKKPWHILVVVDQSGSMLESTVFSAIMASIFAELPAMRTSLVLYDTRVVDISDQLGQPVDVLMKVQLGGGNDTALALRYATGLIRQPARTILVLISDFYEGEGAAERAMVDQVRFLGDSGVRLIGLAALGYDARPFYNKSTATKLRKVGMDVLVCTPEKLAECMADIIRG